MGLLVQKFGGIWRRMKSALYSILPPHCMDLLSEIRTGVNTCEHLLTPTTAHLCVHPALLPGRGKGCLVEAEEPAGISRDPLVWVGSCWNSSFVREQTLSASKKTCSEEDLWISLKGDLAAEEWVTAQRRWTSDNTEKIWSDSSEIFD